MGFELYDKRATENYIKIHSGKKKMPEHAKVDYRKKRTKDHTDNILSTTSYKNLVRKLM